MSENISQRNSMENKRNEKFDVVIMGNLDRQEKLFSKVFPIIKENSNIKHKYLNRFDLSIKERIQFPNDFLYEFYPDILDKLIKIDILIFTYNKNNKLSFEYIKTFYYLYFLNFDEYEKPKNIIIIERDFTKNNDNNNGIVEQIDGEQLASLFKGVFCNFKINEEKLTQVLNECLKKLLKARIT